MRKVFGFFVVVLLFVLIFAGCSNSSISPNQATSTLAPTNIPLSTDNGKKQDPINSKIEPSDAAKAAANADDSGAPYFVVYNYDEIDYLVSAYQNQQGAGNYVGGGESYLVNKSSGKVLTSSKIDFSKVDFNRYLSVYSKLSKEIIN